MKRNNKWKYSWISLQRISRDEQIWFFVNRILLKVIQELFELEVILYKKYGTCIFLENSARANFKWWVDTKPSNTSSTKPNTNPSPSPNLNTNPTPNPYLLPSFEWLTVKNKRQCIILHQQEHQAELKKQRINIWLEQHYTKTDILLVEFYEKRPVGAGFNCIIRQNSQLFYSTSTN